MIERSPNMKVNIDTLPCCYYHNNQAIQNFCCSTGCYLPLCPKCIQTHIDEHDKQGTVPVIKSYADTVFKVVSSIQDSTAKLQSELASFKEYAPNNNISHYIDTINKSRQAIIEQLNSYFESLKKKIEDSLQCQFKSLVSIGADSAQEVINKQISELTVYGTDISAKGHLPSIIKYLSEDRKGKVDQLVAQIQHKKQVYKDSLPSLNINLTDLNGFFTRAICLTIPSKTMREVYLDVNAPALLPAIPPPIPTLLAPRFFPGQSRLLAYSRRLSPSSRGQRKHMEIASLENQLMQLRSQRISSAAKKKIY